MRLKFFKISALLVISRMEIGAFSRLSQGHSSSTVRLMDATVNVFCCPTDSFVRNDCTSYSSNDISEYKESVTLCQTFQSSSNG
jgi:hypothetical protein